MEAGPSASPALPSAGAAMVLHVDEVSDRESWCRIEREGRLWVQRSKVFGSVSKMWRNILCVSVLLCRLPLV